jgi:hypothetical protein
MMQVMDPPHPTQPPLPAPQAPEQGMESIRPSSPDPEQALREALLGLTYRCPKGGYTAGCPFEQLKGLGHSSREGVFARIDGDGLRRLFDLVPSCVCPADHRPEQSQKEGEAKQ